DGKGRCVQGSDDRVPSAIRRFRRFSCFRVRAILRSDDMTILARLRHVSLASLTLALPLLGQPRELAVADSSPFRPLVLPTPNEVRTASGRPGPRYWQQRADYRIVASLDTATHVLRGRETIHYVNNSPGALPYLWLQVEQNICAPNSITSTLDQPPLVFGEVAFDFS